MDIHWENLEYRGNNPQRTVNRVLLRSRSAKHEYHFLGVEPVVGKRRGRKGIKNRERMRGREYKYRDAPMDSLILRYPYTE